MFQAVKGFFSRSRFVPVSDEIEELAKQLAKDFVAQVVFGANIAPDARKWSPALRVVVLGYVDGFVARLYSQRDALEADLLTLLTAGRTLAGAATAEGLEEEYALLRGDEEGAFGAPRKAGWQDADFFAVDKRKPHLLREAVGMLGDQG